MLETIKVVRDCPRGYKIINKSDFDPKKHELFGEPKEAGPTIKEMVAELKLLGVDIPKRSDKSAIKAMYDKAKEEAKKTGGE